MAITITHNVKSTTEWDEYVNSHPDSTLYHLSSWKNIGRQNLGVQDVSLAANKNGQIVGILPLFHVKSFLGRNYITSGIFGSYEGVICDNEMIGRMLLEKAIEISKKNKCHFSVIKDYRKHDYSNLQLKGNYVTFVSDLNSGIEEVWMKMKDKTRNQIRKAQKNGLSSKIDNIELQNFYNVYMKNMNYIGSPCVGINFFKDILSEFRNQAKVFLIKFKKKIIAGGIMLTFKDSAYMPFASSLREYSSLCPNNMLYWEAIQYACSNGYRYFDFGRSTIDSGTFDFKKQWGTIQRPLYYYYYCDNMRMSTFDPNDKKYQKSAKLWRKLPICITNLIGPHFIKLFV